MNPMTWARRRRPIARRPRSTRLHVESIEERLAPSTILPSPTPHLPSLVVRGDCASTNLVRIAGIPAHEQPPDPC
jgi:hypothetical protein